MRLLAKASYRWLKTYLVPKRQCPKRAPQLSTWTSFCVPSLMPFLLWGLRLSWLTVGFLSGTPVGRVSKILWNGDKASSCCFFTLLFSATILKLESAVFSCACLKSLVSTYSLPSLVSPNQDRLSRLSVYETPYNHHLLLLLLLLARLQAHTLPAARTLPV